MEEVNEMNSQNNKELRVSTRFRVSNPKRFITIVVLVLWIAFSCFYIIRDLWQDFQVSQLNDALNQGYTTAVTQLYEQVNNEDCSAVTLTNGDDSLQLINVACLQAAEGAATETPIQ